MSTINMSELRSSFLNELTDQEIGSVKGGDDHGGGSTQNDNNLAIALLTNYGYEEVFQIGVNQNGEYNASNAQQQDT